MSIHRILFSTFLFVFIHIFSFAQQQPMPKTLLWKISGKGLTKPSYLFGTMHLTDKRLFRHDDSVFYSISSTEGFAMEINPEELATYMINKELNSLEDKQKLENILDAEDYMRHKKALGKKFNKDPDDITVSEIVQEKNKWINEFMAKGEMPTMLDAYLYNIARKQGKWIGGVEDLVDQTGLQEDLVDISDIENLLSEHNSEKAANKQLEAMIRIYQAGDLNALENIVNGTQSSRERDLVLIKRNVKMARRMDSLSAIRSMFFAVGAAHLPGDSGVIDLLKRKGFNVEPVFSKRKINASDYKFQEVELPWVTIKDPKGLYEVKMPGAPVEFKHLGLVNMRIHMDLFNLTAYNTLATSTPLDVSKPDSLFLMFAENIFKSSKGFKTTVLDSAGVHGREYVGTVANTSTRVRLYLKGNLVYMAMAINLKKDQSLSADMKKFFNSFVINQSFNPNRAELYTFTDSILGVQLTSPAELFYNEKISRPAGEHWIIKAFTGADLNSGAYIMLMSKEPHPGQYITNDSVLLYENFDRMMADEYGKLKKEEIVLQGLPALMFQGVHVDNEKLTLKVLTTVRSNRNIILMVVAKNDFFEKEEDRKIFESLRLIPHAVRSWKYYTDSTNTFTSWAPAPFQWQGSNEDGGKRGIAFSHDSIVYNSFSVIIDTLNEYYSTKSDSIYWKTYENGLIRENDSLISVKSFTNGKQRWYEFISRKDHSNIHQRVRAALFGNCLVSLYTSSQLKELYDDNVLKFFNDFKVHAKETAFSLTTSKSKRLLQDLSSKDSATKAKAVKSLYNTDFYPEDSLILHAALVTDYKMTEEERAENDINYIIAEKLIALQLTGTIDFIKRNYKGTTSENLRAHMLYILTNLKTKESIAALAALMVESKPVKELNYASYSVLLDSLDLALTFIDNAKALRGDSIHGTLQAVFYSRLLDSGMISRQRFDEAESDFIRVLNSDVKATDSVRLLLGNSWDLVRVVGKYKSQAAMGAIRGYLNDSRKFLRMQAVIQLLNGKQKVDPAVINKFVTDAETRLDFYNALKEINKESFFRADFKNQKSFSESVLYTFDEDYDLLSRSYVGSKTATVKGKTYRFYLWKVTFDSEDRPGTYLAIIGGFPLDSKDVLISNDISGYDSTKIIGEVPIDTIFDDFIRIRNEEE